MFVVFLPSRSPASSHNGFTLNLRQRRNVYVTESPPRSHCHDFVRSASRRYINTYESASWSPCHDFMSSWSWRYINTYESASWSPWSVVPFFPRLYCSSQNFYPDESSSRSVNASLHIQFVSLASPLVDGDICFTLLCRSWRPSEVFHSQVFIHEA